MRRGRSLSAAACSSSEAFVTADLLVVGLDLVTGREVHAGEQAYGGMAEEGSQR
jgi:hypothetical protein